MGADYLEQDVVATSDDELVVLHDIYLDRVTDVAQRYPERHRGDGRFYVRDFTLNEVRTLEVHERCNADGTPVYSGRYQPDGETFHVHTFADELEFVARLQGEGARPVGIYAEIKRPSWQREEGVDIAPRLLKVMAEFGYKSRKDRAYLQCFDAQELIRVRETLDCDLKLIQLIGENAWGETDTDFDELRSEKGLEVLAKTVDGIGPWVNQIYDLRDPDGKICDSGLVSRAHAQGLAVHPYTLRRDDLPPGFNTFEELLSFVIAELSVDGVFTDFPDLVASAAADRLSADN